MTSAKKIRELAEALNAANGSSAERLDRLDLQGRLDRLQVTEWAQVIAALPIVGIASITAMDAFGDSVDLGADAEGLVDQELRIQVMKTHSATTAFCITEDGVSAVFADSHVATSIRQVRVACDFDPFRTESCQVAPWGIAACAEPTAGEESEAPDPRRLVKDFVGSRVPKSVFPYILVSDAPATSKVFERWRDLAVVRMLNSLVNEVQATDREQIVITGTRPRKIDNDLKAPFSDELFVAATAAAKWVYASGRDVDTRFALFTYELSREWPEGLNFKGGFEARGEFALEAANTAFRAYVQETSKDTLKSLGDLRKTLGEEVTKVVSQTRELMTTMWRDFMVAATSFLGRVVLLGSDKPISNPLPLKFLLSGAAIFLGFSLVLSLKTNAKFMAISDASRLEWRRKLYGFMNGDDFKKLSDVPIDQSVQEYKRVVRWVVVGYVAVIVCLLWTAWDAQGGGSSGSVQETTRRAVPAFGTPSAASFPVSSASAASSVSIPGGALQRKAGAQVAASMPTPPATKIP